MRHGRRAFLGAATAGAALAAVVPRAMRAADLVLGPASLPSGTLAESVFAALPGKDPLIKKTWRPPNFETPVSRFRDAFTPNAAFFVRYHLANIPEIDGRAWRLKISGDAANQPYELSLAQLRAEFEPVEMNALCLCSGNRRGLSDPHVPGIQWGHGAMGNARWRGVRLKDVLVRVGLKKEALEVVFDGADSGALTQTPDFIKSIPVWKALDENTILAYEMNGEPLPHWHGFPVRAVVPGWTATYWMKHLMSINAVAQPFKGFWMTTAYRIPKGRFPLVDRFVSQEGETNTPITEMVVSSLIANLQDGQRIAANQPMEISGVAWDGGYGIEVVDVSIDGGRTWQSAQLGPDYGRYAWRQWRFTLAAPRPGAYVVMAKATNRLGASQTFQLVFNPAGYHNNVVERINIEAV